MARMKLILAGGAEVHVEAPDKVDVIIWRENSYIRVTADMYQYGTAFLAADEPLQVDASQAPQQNHAPLIDATPLEQCHQHQQSVEQYLRTHSVQRVLTDLLRSFISLRTRVGTLEQHMTQQNSAITQIDNALDSFASDFGDFQTQFTKVTSELEGAITDLENSLNSNVDPTPAMQRITALQQQLSTLATQTAALSVPTTANPTGSGAAPSGSDGLTPQQRAVAAQQKATRVP